MSLFNTGGGKAAKFPQPGATITGKIAQMPFEKQATKFGSQEPDFWPNGDPKMDVVVPLEDTNAPREDGNDDGERTIYVSSGKMKRAIANAIQTAGVQDVAIGGTLTVTYVGNDPASKNPANPAKLYDAQYTPPASGLAQTAAPQQAAYQVPVPAAPAQAAAPQQQPAAAPPAAPVAAAPDPGGAALAGVTQDVFDKVKQLLAIGGLTHDQIGAAVGITADQVATIEGRPF